MQDLKPKAFFDLAKFKYAFLFDDCEFVWDAIKKIDAYLDSYKEFKIDVPIPEGVFLENREKISIGIGTVVEPGAYIRGPCIIGENCTIRHGAYIRGHVLTGRDCVIGHTTEVKSSIFLNHAKAGHFAYVGNTILGNDVNVGAGTAFANLKLDDKEIAINVNGQTIKTGLRKFGAIIGDHCQLGCNSVTNPGTVLGKNVWGYPCLNLGGFIPAESIVKPSEKAIIVPKKQKST